MEKNVRGGEQMELEFGIEDLLNGKRVESDRLEFKAGWNPDDIYPSICAFANDFDNQGGGYIIIGVQEENGIAKRPVKGIEEAELDAIQKDMLGFNKKIIPEYFPKTIIDKVDDRYVIVLWVPTGIQRPYKIPEHVTSKREKSYKYFIRYNTSSISATTEQEKELIQMAGRIPFDEQPNSVAGFDDISLVLLEEHLKATGSKLAKQVSKRGVKDILEEMKLLTGEPERLRIKNVALMMFCEEPDRFFPYMQVDIVKFPNGSVKDPNNFIEVPSIKGSVPSIIKRTMEKLQDMVIEERITKVDYQMEAVRRFSYPYQALEEAVVNAFYHRDYMSYEPVHIEIEPECINIISFPGIDRSVPMDVIKRGERFRTRVYRNRRLGEFLKELHLSEGHSTGVPTIQDELAKNGSPRAVFETDEDRRGLCVRIPIHPDFLKDIDDSNSKQVDADSSSSKKINIDNDIFEKVDIGNEKVDIQNKKVDIEEGKIKIEIIQEETINRQIVRLKIYEKELRKLRSSKPTIENMHQLFQSKGCEQIFGRKDVIEELGLSPAGASKFIAKLLEANIVKNVKGYGKGRYKFVG